MVKQANAAPLKCLINRQHRIVMSKPAVRWQDALPSGNGSLGALVYGNIEEDTILINHEALWYGERTLELPNLSVHLKELRKMLSEGKYAEANQLYPNKMREAGYKASTAKYQPGFDLKLFSDVRGAFRGYRRTLDMETGEISITWSDHGVQMSRHVFVSRPDDMVVMSIRCNESNLPRTCLQFMIHDPSQAELHGFTHDSNAEGDYLYAWGQHKNAAAPFCAVARVIHSGQAKVSDQQLVMENIDEFVVLLKVSAKQGTEKEMTRLKEELAVYSDDYFTLLGRHAAEHRTLFARAGIDLNAAEQRDIPNERLLLDAYDGDVPTVLMERMYDYGRYLLISSSRPGGLPANLQGIWNGDYTPAWSSAFFNNENIQMNYWQALAGNLPEATAPFFDFFDSLLPDMRKNAKAFFGCRGILSPLFASPDSGLKKSLHPHVVYWTAGAGWLAQHYYDYWLFTGDETFARERAIPFLKECAEFYEDFLIEDVDGKWNFSPSNSPENHPIGDFEGSGELSICLNATMDIAVAKEVLSNLCLLCSEFGLEQGSLPRWQRMLEKLPDYQINEDGAIREWMHPDFKDNYHHRHLSHLYPLFPGFEITEETHPELFQACQIAVEKRLVIGLSQQTGWSLAHMANIYARLGDGDRALECLELLSRSCLGDNLFTYHNDWRRQGITSNRNNAPFQIEANFGWTAAIQEMLLFSTPGRIKLLPALPSRWTNGQFQNFRCRGGITVSMKWDFSEKKAQVVFAADYPQEVEIQFPMQILHLESIPQVITHDSKTGCYVIKLPAEQPVIWHVTFA